MGSDSEDDDGKEDQAAAINNIVQPIRKQMKKLSSKLDKMAGLVKALEEERDKEKEAREMSEKQLAETKESTRELQMKLDAAPWKLDGERFESLIKATDASLRNILDEQRVQVAAHSQVFASTQSTVSDISQKQATLSAENHDHTRRAAEELRTINARLDHMRGEFSERVTHTFEEGTKHADRLGARLQEDLHRLDQEVSLRASAKSVGESTAALRSELAEVKSTNDELRRDLRSNQVQLQELRDGQQNYVTKSSLAGSTASIEQRLTLLEEAMRRVEASQRETEGALSDGRFGQRQQLIENRQVTMERAVKQVEAKLAAFGEDLNSRPLKTDVISAIAQQELSVEACATREQVEKLEAAIANSAEAAKLAALAESLRIVQERAVEQNHGLNDLRDLAASKQDLALRVKELEALKLRLEDKLGREEGQGLLASKLDKSEAQSLLRAQEQTQASAVGAEAHAKRLQDSLSTMSNQALDAQSGVKQMNSRVDKLSAMTHELETRLNQRKAEVQSLTRVMRLMLEDAEMRCSIDEAEGATAAEASDVLARLKGVGNNRGGAPMHITGVTLHKQPGGPLQPIPPGSAAADKVWYKQTLQPRGEVLGEPAA